MLVPRELDMVEAGKHTPLPLPKPPLPQEAKLEPKTETGDARSSVHRSHQPPQPISRRQAKLRSRSGA
jgi:hypothetical protein